MRTVELGVGLLGGSIAGNVRRPQDGVCGGWQDWRDGAVLQEPQLGGEIMARTGDSDDRMTKWMRWVARVWSIAVIGITLVMIIGHVLLPEPSATDYPPIENLLPLLMCLSVVGLGVAWRWESLGGAINVGFFLANLGMYWAIRGKLMPLSGAVVLSLALVPGILFLACWWRTRSQSSLNSA